MSGSARKRKSPWDRLGETQLPAQISEKNAWHEKESYSDVHVRHDPKWSDIEDDNALRSKDVPGRPSGELSKRSGGPKDDPKWSDLEDNNALKSKDFSGRPSWELSKRSRGPKDDRRGLNDIPVTRKAWDGDKSYHVSSGFDGLEQRNHSHSPESRWSQSSRSRWSRSQSRSRSRGRARGRSRSLSRGRERSRSRDRGRDRDRSRSPLGNNRQESYRWNDRRRSGPGVPSQPCRDFAMGKCRRGSECRFLHEDNVNHKDGGRSERERSERGRNTQERRANRYDGDKDEPPRIISKSTMLCNDFLKGRCHRGSSCRYPHHDGSGFNSERSNRNSSFDDDYKRLPHKDGNAPCKFFMMGKCFRDNCKFSHDGPVHGYTEGKSQGDSRGNNFDDMKESWNGPKWGEATSVSDISQSTGWGDVAKETFGDQTTAEKQTNDRRGHTFEDKNKRWNGPIWGDATGVSEVGMFKGWGNSNADNVNLTGPMNAEKHADDGRGRRMEGEGKEWNGPTWGDATGVSDVGQFTGWGNNDAENINLTDPRNAEKCADDWSDPNLDNERRMWGGPEWENKASEIEENASPRLGSGSHVLEVGITNSKDVAKSFDTEEPPLTPHSLPSETMREASGGQLATSDMHSIFLENSQIQQHHTKMGDNATTDDFNSINGADIYGNASHSAFASQTTSVGGINQTQNMVSVNPSNGLNIDLNGPVQHNSSPSNLQNLSQIQIGESVKTLVNSTMPQKTVNNAQVGQPTDFPASLMQVIGNGQLPQLYAALNTPNSAELVPSLPHSASLDTQPDPATMSGKQYDPIGDSMEPNKPGNCNQPTGFSSDSVEQKNQMLMEHSSPPSAVGFDSGKPPKNGYPEGTYRKSPELRQQKPVANSVVEENSKSIAEKPKQDPEIIRAENVDVDSIGKDEKAMRLFKIALVEFVKEILKPKWKEGQMSREVHKNIVKKVVDKVTSTIQGVNVPKTQDKIDQYLACSKPKLAKLVEAYTERFSKTS